MNQLTINAAERHAIVTIEGLDIVWHTMAGGGVAVSVVDDPYSSTGEVIAGNVSADNIILATGFSPHDDLHWMNELKRSVGVGRYTVTRQWTDENWRHIGDPETYPDCLLIGYTNPTTGPTGDDAEFAITLHTTGEAI